MIMAPAQSLANAQCGQHVELQRMPHELHIRHRGEDWAGITNQKERKKLQNRLNKRVCKRNPKYNWNQHRWLTNSSKAKEKTE